MKKLKLILLLLPVIGFMSCGKDDGGSEEPKKEVRPKNLEQYNLVSEGLKDYYKSDEFFYIGAAIEPGSIDKPLEVALMKRHFNSLTAENVMKWSTLQPTEGNFVWTHADKIVNFAQENGMKVRGHTLVWHSQAPNWIFLDNGVTASKALVLQRMRDHITAVMTRYKGKVYAWDVVNEAISDNQSDIYRSDSKWQNICGEEFILEAFRTARQVDPAAKLFYNDYAATQPVKRDKIFNLLKKLKDENLVDGVGLQGHWNVDAPSNERIIDAFDKYKSLGIELHITELDVSIYPNSSDLQTTYTETVAQKQMIAYARFFQLFRSYKNNVTNVTFWGLADNHTWLDNHPTPGRKNYPFLFGTDYNPKPAYFAVINF